MPLDAEYIADPCIENLAITLYLEAGKADPRPTLSWFDLPREDRERWRRRASGELPL